MQIFEFDLKKKIKNLTSLFLQAEFCILLFWQCLTNFFFDKLFLHNFTIKFFSKQQKKCILILQL